MKLIARFAFILALLCCASAAHAQGTCPSGLPVSGTHCYFADPVAGSDTNNGTSESTPFKYLPGMVNCANNCAAVTPTSSEGFIVKGNGVYHVGNASASAYMGAGNTKWSWTWSGSSANCQLDDGAGTIKQSSCIYIGVDKTWYSGGSWGRPVLDGDNTPNNGEFVASCTYDETNANTIQLLGSYLIWDNFEVRDNCSQIPATGGTPAWFVDFETQIMFENFYYHGWTIGPYARTAISAVSVSGGNATYTYTLTSGSTPVTNDWVNIYGLANAGNNGKFQVSGTGSGTFTVANGSGVNASGQSGTGDFVIDQFQLLQAQGGSVGFFRFSYSIIDGSDSTWGGLNYASTGQGIGVCTEIDNSVVRYISNLCVAGGQQTDYVYNNLFEYMYDGTAGSHGNIIEQQAQSLGDIHFYNNMVRHTDEGISLDFWSADGHAIYYFNNINYDNANSANCLLVGGAMSGTNNAYYTNNTLDYQPNVQNNTNGGCNVMGGGGNTSSSMHAGFQNNHTINVTGTQAFTTIRGTGSTLFTENGNESWQTPESVATAQGYVFCLGTPTCSTGNSGQPTTGNVTTNITYHAGANLSASCATYSFDSALCYGSTGGETSTIGSGVLSGYLVPSPTARSTTFDSGAWQFPITGGSICNAPTASPTSGIPPQSVTLSSSTGGCNIFYSTSGTANCSSTSYSGPISVTVNPTTISAITCQSMFTSGGPSSWTYSGTTATAPAITNFVGLTPDVPGFVSMVTPGDWQGRYGADGYAMALGPQALPSYVSGISFAGDANWNWNAEPTDMRGLKLPTTGEPLASCWYAKTPWSFTVTITDGQVHPFTISAIDWDSTTRCETIAVSGSLTDSRSLCNFNAGAFLTWNIGAKTTFTMTSQTGANSVVNALFFN